VVARLAEAIFAQRGFRGTTIRQVAARARCSVGQIYKLFPSKLDLYRGILETRGEKLGALVDAIVVEPGSVRGRLERIVRAVLAFFQENSDFFHIYSIETGAGHWTTALNPRRSRLGKLRRHGLEAVAGLVREGQQSGELRSDLDPMQATIALFGMIKGYSGEQMWSRTDQRLEDGAEVILRLFFHGASKGGRA
jgi:AcrR family transcriptional regulator